MAPTSSTAATSAAAAGTSRTPSPWMPPDAPTWSARRPPARTASPSAAHLRHDGRALLSCGYIGGENPDHGAGVAVAPDGSVHVAGETFSPETSFPVTAGPDLTYNPGHYKDDGDAWVAKLRPDSLT